MISERISDGIPPQMKILHMVIPILMHLKLERCKPHNATRHLMKCDIIDDVKLFPTVYRRIYSVYRRIYCRKFFTLSNQTSCCKSKCIRISYNSFVKWSFS